MLTRMLSVSIRRRRQGTGAGLLAGAYRGKRASALCWAAPHGSDATATRYRLKVTRRRGGCYRLPLTTTEQRRLYNKMRKCGLDRAEALRVVMRAPADVRPLSSTF